ncbi:transposon ty3-i Gag-Pol polyprotein [Plakobranchus ocellatus]|uniref:Transposon ty3-i Gag-Pol polyprotein n=1 Tax=Plakobranchus ocellatus TaxID=259542 RepID=A0AAV4CL58_9GAST|nr:transposon ty3-i Gag-Pol polyprotein [Plakobranchus ocellatus]
MAAIAHACKKFHFYVFGNEVTVFTDHKPLEQIFKKQLLSAPMRLQRMLLALQWYDLKVNYKKGKDMQLPDTLSRAYLEDVEQEIILQGWPERKRDVPREVQQYYESRCELNTVDGIIYKSLRIVVPPSLRKYAMDLIHKSHMGMVKCKQKGREVFFWPSMNAEIEQKVKNCQSANGKAERSVQIVKKLWSKCKVKYLAILDYNTTPLENIKASPAQLLMGRRPRNPLPAVKELYELKAIKRQKPCKQYFKNKEKQKFYYDRKEWTLEPLGNHTPVRLQPIAGSKVWTPARITGKLGPRSYAVTLEDSTFRRNRRHIIRSTEQANKQHVMSGDVVDDEADNFDAKNNNSGLPDTSPPLVEVPPSPTKREFSSSLPLNDNVSQRAHSNNASTHQYVTRSGCRVRKPDKYTL